MNADSQKNPQEPQTPRNLKREIAMLRAQVERIRSRSDWADLATLRTYEEMIETRLRQLGRS
jgi:hypothetical protein